MFFLTTLAAAIISSSSLVLATPTTPAARDDPHIVDFRTYGAPGCFEANQGVYTYTQSNLDICYQFGIHGEEPVGSIFVVDIVDGCSVYVYTDDACAEGAITVPVGIANCYNTTASLRSFQTVCST